MRRILIHEEACIGCGLCIVHCTVQHSQSKDIVKTYKREYPRPLVVSTSILPDQFLPPFNAVIATTPPASVPASQELCKSMKIRIWYIMILKNAWAAGHASWSVRTVQ